MEVRRPVDTVELIGVGTTGRQHGQDEVDRLGGILAPRVRPG